MICHLHSTMQLAMGQRTPEDASTAVSRIRVPLDGAAGAATVAEARSPSSARTRDTGPTQNRATAAPCAGMERMRWACSGFALQRPLRNAFTSSARPGVQTTQLPA
jgi:hypothetical protein